MRSSGSPRAVSIRIGTCEWLRTRLGQVEAGLARHHHVEDQQVEGHALHQRARLGGVRRGADPIAIGGQIALQQRAQPLVIVDDEQVRIVPWPIGRPLMAAIPRTGCRKALATLAVFAPAMLQYLSLAGQG